MQTPETHSCTAFAGGERIAAGDIESVARVAQAAIDAGEQRTVLVFDDATADHVSAHARSTADDVVGRLRRTVAPEALADSESQPGARQQGPGRPKLGVIGREVTLLPRHWAWLNAQPGGASVALRKLVENARRTSVTADRVRSSQEAAYRFMVVMAGDEPGFEEATRALFAGSAERFSAHVGSWPPDVRDFATSLAAAALEPHTAP
jgi:uncharacterized protein